MAGSAALLRRNKRRPRASIILPGQAADFARFTGRAAKVWTEEPVGEMKFFEGRLAGVVDDRVSGSVLTDPGTKIRLELKGKTPRIVEVPLALIRKAHLVVEF